MDFVTLITGGSNGIGRAISQARQALGETVLVLDREPPPAADRVFYAPLDLADIEEVERVMQQVTSTHEVTRLVTCAGVALLSPLESLAAGDFRKTMDINVLAPAMIAKTVVATMKEAGFGRILNISSRAALGRQLRTSYSASKGGLISATRVWALELADFGITVNAVAPGPIETELYRAANPPDSELTKKVVAAVPVRRLGMPEDIALAADYFLDDRAGFVTGQTLFVCGGLTIGGIAT
jgi:NAD(P)-dependent dehydrogenase (short-subunit alcohol dehydrogenase family)